MADRHAALIVGPNWVGDMVMAHSLVQALTIQDPTRPIDVMATRPTAPIARRMREVRNVIEVPIRHRSLQLALRWRTARSLAGIYEQALVLPRSISSALVPWLAGIPRRTGLLGEYRYLLLNDIHKIDPSERRRTAKAFRSLAGDGPLLQPVLMVDEENQSRLCQRWALTPGQYIVLAPGAEFGAAKRWPAEHYAQFARHALDTDLLGSPTRVVIVGSPGDRDVGEAIRASAPGTINTCGETSLLDAVDLIGAAGLIVANDSGLMHVAAAVSRPVVAIFGSTLPDHTPPLSDLAVTVTRRLECAPCFKRTCPLGHTNCLTTLTWTQVLRAAREVLTRMDGTGPSPS